MEVDIADAEGCLMNCEDFSGVIDLAAGNLAYFGIALEKAWAIPKISDSKHQ
jgi:hypothetical protein